MLNYVPTGIKGLDFILNGGYPAGSSLIVEGAPGTGKTTLGLQFLYDGAVNHEEAGIYITFEELPDQIYKDVLNFGWDLRDLERKNLLRVICMSPDTLFEQMVQSGGLFENIVKEMDCKRIVIDSVNLFKYNFQDKFKYRQTIYTLRNILRKFSLTSLLIREQSSHNEIEIPFEHYVSDGVIRLSLKEHYTHYRKRTLELLKMRGTNMIEGEHIYRITNEGFHLIPARSMVEDLTVIQHHANISTGISHLDKLLNGGLSVGSVFMFDTNSKANYKYILTSILIHRLLNGEKVLALFSNLITLIEFSHLLHLFGMDLQELVNQKKVYFIENYRRPVPEWLTKNIFYLDNVPKQDYLDFIKTEVHPLIKNSSDKWFVYYDLNAIFSKHGKELVEEFFTEEVTKVREYDTSILAQSNFAELGKETSALFERISNGVLRTWMDGNYQYLQIPKSPEGRISEPLLVENILEKPFIRLV